MVNLESDEAARRWPTFDAAVRRADFASVHALPMRLRDDIVGAMNLFLTRPGTLESSDLALGQGLADIATIGLLQEGAPARIPAASPRPAADLRGSPGPPSRS